jgi:hypothetical protein
MVSKIIGFFVIAPFPLRENGGLIVRSFFTRSLSLIQVEKFYNMKNAEFVKDFGCDVSPE